MRENVTLLRRDENEEAQLISFIVPDLKEWQEWLKERGQSDESSDTSLAGMMQRFQPLRQALRDYMKTKVNMTNILWFLQANELNPGSFICRSIPHHST